MNSRSHEQRSIAAKKAWKTRKKNDPILQR